MGRYGAGSAGPHAVTSAGGQTYSYDANGNMTSGNGRVVTWTSFNKPATVSGANGTMSVQYDADHNRIMKSDANGSTVYVGGGYEKETANGVVKHRYFVRAGSQVIARVERQQDGGTWQIEQTEYLLRDHLGSVDTVVNSLGGIVERLSFDASGKRRLENWQDGLVSSDFNHGYTGHEHDENRGQNTVSANIASSHREQPQGGGHVAQTTFRPARKRHKPGSHKPETGVSNCNCQKAANWYHEFLRSD